MEDLNMKENFTANARISIKARADTVWKALTDPKLIKEYMFGTDVVSEWKVGSPIVYKGVWQGKPYEEKGTILEMAPGRLLKSTYWSGMSGLEDKPENYNTITYALSEKDGATTLSIVQDNNRTQEAAAHSEGNWKMVLEGLKKLLEK
jgi:uncharacterized protein YndB with AHSA1/START domain